MSFSKHKGFLHSQKLDSHITNFHLFHYCEKKRNLALLAFLNKRPFVQRVIVQNYGTSYFIVKSNLIFIKFYYRLKSEGWVFLVVALMWIGLNQINFSFALLFKSVCLSICLSLQGPKAMCTPGWPGNYCVPTG